MKYIALILGLIMPVTLLSCAKAEAQTAKQNVELDSLEEKVAALEAQLGTNLKYEKDDYGSERWYDSNGNLIHHKDSKGYEEWYDSNGNLIHYKGRYGYEEWYEYDSRGNEIHYKDRYGDETWYDSDGHKIHHKDSKGYEEWYDSNGHKIHFKDSDGNEEWYDSDGHEIHEKRSDGYEEWHEYDSNGNLIHSKDSNGDEGWTEYDSNGHKIHEKRSDGYEEWHEYDSNGNEIHSKDSNGYEGWTEYDSNGHKIHSKDSNGDEKWYEYENVTDSDYWYDMFVYDSNGRLTFSGYGKEDNVFGLFDEETSYVYDDTGNLVHTTTNFGGSGNDWYREERDYWSNGMIKNFHSESKRSETDVLFNNEGKVPLSEEYVKLEPYMCYVYVEYKNSRSFRIWCVTAEEDSMKLGKTTFDSEAFEIHYDKSGKINTVKAWHQEKEINYAFYYLLYLDISTILSREKNLEISENNTITFKQWPPDMGGDVIHEKLLPKTDWEKYFDKNGNFTAVDLSWINKCWFKKYENDECLRPQKNKH